MNTVIAVEEFNKQFGNDENEYILSLNEEIDLNKDIQREKGNMKKNQ